MVSVDRYDNYLSKKVSLGTQIFIFCQIWKFKKQYYEEVNKFWLVSYEIEQAPTYENPHSVPTRYVETNAQFYLFQAIDEYNRKEQVYLERAAELDEVTAKKEAQRYLLSLAISVFTL